MINSNYSKIVNEFLRIPVFSRIVANSGYKSVGIKILDGGKLIQETTSFYDKKKINMKVGIQNPDFIVTVDNKFLKSLNKTKIGWIKRNPVKAYLRYYKNIEVPLLVKLKILNVLVNEV